MRAKPTVTVVVVLYRRTPENSCAVATLMSVLDSEPDLARRFYRVIFDNTPTGREGYSRWESLEEAQVTSWRNFRILADPRNPGLSVAYEYARVLAHEQHCEWLMLLDQDTSVTREYIVEVMRTIDTQPGIDSRVDILAPKLCSPARVLSPHRPPRLRAKPLAREVGLLSGRVLAFNSGLVVRISALDDIDGFPKDFTLDYVDHALLHRLQSNKSQVHALSSRLHHDLAFEAGHESIDPRRYMGWLAAEEHFYRTQGDSVARGWWRARRVLRFLVGVVRGRRGPLLLADLDAIWRSL